MKLSNKQIENITILKQDGDNIKLANLLKKDVSTVSRIVTGKQDTTLHNIKAIVSFYIKRKKEIINVNNQLCNE